jgi:outer membrane protein
MSLKRVGLPILVGALWMASMPAKGAELVPSLDAPAHGFESDTTAGDRNYSIGLGAGLAPDYEGSDDYAAVPIWNLRAGNVLGEETFVQLFGPTFRSNFLPDDHWRVGVSGRYLPDYDNVDDDRVQDIGDTDDAFLAGLTIGYDVIAGRAQDLAIEVDAQYDVLEGNGGIVTPRLRYRTALSQPLVLDTSVSATWASEDYMSNRLGISSGDAARSGLDEFDADSGIKNGAITTSITYVLGRAWSLTGLAGYSRLFNDAEDSPIVDDQGDANQVFGGALINYSF